MRWSNFLWLFAAWSALPSFAAVQIEPLAPAHPWALFECRITGVPAASNPFDPDVIALDAEVTAPSGHQRSIPAFWYQGYQRALVQGKETLTPEGTPEWRLRILPTETGSYHLSLTITTNGQPAGAPVRFDFNVSPSATPPAEPGFVRVAPNHEFFETDQGVALPLIGHCACWYGQRGTYDYDDWFTGMHAADENYTRIWMAPWAFGIEEGPHTGLHYRLDRAWQLDYVLEQAAQKGIYVLLCLDYHGMFETQPDYWGGNNNWPNNPYNAVNGGPCQTQDEFFTLPAAEQMYRKRLRYLIARYSWDPRLLAWQFFNELDNVYRYLNPAHVAAWHAAMGDWLKAHDPYHHLVTTSLTGGSDRADIWSLPEMDFACYHSYGQSQPAAALPGIVHSFVTRYDKPMLVGEFGTDWRGWRLEQDPFLRGWRQGIWATALSGAAGTAMSWWWQQIQADGLYPYYRALADFTANTHWGQGTWSAISFQTNGPPPNELGSLKPDGTPFDATLQLSSAWGEHLSGRLALANPLSATFASGVLNSYVQGSAHPDLRTPFLVQAWLTNNARLVIHLNSVSEGAILSVRVDGQEIFRRSLPNKDGQHTVNNEYNEDIPVPLPAGKHTVEIRNAGGDWFYLDWVRFEGVLPSHYVNDWQASPVATGIRHQNEALLYVVNPAASWPANATNADLEPLHGAAIVLRDLPKGGWSAHWYNPTNDAPVGITSGQSDGTRLTLPLPDFAVDLAGRLEAVKPFALSPPQRTDGHLTLMVQGEAGRNYALQTSADLVRWEDLTTGLANGETWTTPLLSVQGGRYYRARLEK